MLMAGVTLVLGGIMLICAGLLGEMMMRTYFESQGRRIYAIREIRTRQPQETREGNR